MNFSAVLLQFRVRIELRHMRAGRGLGCRWDGPVQRGYGGAQARESLQAALMVSVVSLSYQQRDGDNLVAGAVGSQLYFHASLF